MSAPGTVVENTEYAKFTARIMRAFARRAGGDVDLLPALRDVQVQIDDLMRTAVARCRTEGYSWAEIAQRLGTTRQAAQQRYGGNRAAQLRTAQMVSARDQVR